MRVSILASSLHAHTHTSYLDLFYSVLFFFPGPCFYFILFLPRAVETFVAAFLLHAESSSQSVLCNPAKPTAKVTSTNPPKLAPSIYDLRHVESFSSFFIFFYFFCCAQCRDIFATFFFIPISVRMTVIFSSRLCQFPSIVIGNERHPCQFDTSMGV